MEGLHVSAGLRAAALFIDKLADLIPAKHLNDSSAQSDVRFLKKAEREAKTAQWRSDFQERKRERLNPDHKHDDGNKRDGGDRRDAPEGPEGPKGPDSGPAVNGNTSDALRLKLQKRLEEMRKKRKADELQEKVKSVKEWKNDALDPGRKKAAGQQRQARQKLSKAKGGSVAAGKNTSNDTRNQLKGKKVPNHEAEPQQKNDFSFSKIEFDGQPQFKKRGSKKPSKQDLLEQIEKDQNRVLTKAEEKAKAWKAALARVHGEKVLDNPRLLRKSIKKDTKSAEKRQKTWNERVEKVKEQHKQKQHKRRANLQARATGKIQKKIQRREKKLTGGNRAGFEGRKSTPIKM